MSISKHRLSSDIAQVDDLLLDGSDIYVYARRPDDQTAILTDLRTGEEMSFAPERILAMKLIIPGAIIQTGGEPHHIVDVSETHHITYTSGGGGEPQGMPPVFYADTLAAVRRRNYGTVGNQQAVNDDPDAESDAILGAIADELRDMTADEFTDALDAVADALLDAVGEPDLAADAALPELLDDDLPPAEDEELPPGEPQPLPEDVELGWRVGDKFQRHDGRGYTITAIEGDYVNLEHMIDGVEFNSRVLASGLPRLMMHLRRPAPAWADIDVTTETDLIQARQRIAQLEDELARLHNEDRDTEPLAPETVAEAVRASQEMASIDIIDPREYRVKSKTLPPVDISDPAERDARDDEMAHLRNEGWFTVFETIAVAAPDATNDISTLYHVARLEFPYSDDPRGDGEPEHRDIIDQAIDVVDAYEPAEQPENADAEDIVTEGDLAPIERIDAGRFPITEAIRQRGLSAVMDEMDAEAMAAFRNRRDVGAHHDTPMIITGGQS